MSIKAINFGAEKLGRLKNIPILHKFDPGEQFEGFITLFPDTLFIADTERHSKKSLEKFFIFALQYYQNIIYAEAPQARRFMHPDMIFNRIQINLNYIFLLPS